MPRNDSGESKSASKFFFIGKTPRIVSGFPEGNHRGIESQATIGPQQRIAEDFDGPLAREQAQHGSCESTYRIERLPPPGPTGAAGAGGDFPMGIQTDIANQPVEVVAIDVVVQQQAPWPQQAVQIMKFQHAVVERVHTVLEDQIEFPGLLHQSGERNFGPRFHQFPAGEPSPSQMFYANAPPLGRLVGIKNQMYPPPRASKAASITSAEMPMAIPISSTFRHISNPAI